MFVLCWCLTLSASVAALLKSSFTWICSVLMINDSNINSIIVLCSSSGRHFMSLSPVYWGFLCDDASPPAVTHSASSLVTSFFRLLLWRNPNRGGPCPGQPLAGYGGAAGRPTNQRRGLRWSLAHLLTTYGTFREHAWTRKQEISIRYTWSEF